MNRRRITFAALSLFSALAGVSYADQQLIYKPSAMPRVDIHTHMDAKTQYAKAVEAMDQWGGTISISLAGLFWVKDNEGNNASPASVKQIPGNDMLYVKEKLHDRILFVPGAFTIPSQGIWWSVDEIKNFKEQGFVGLKLWPHGAILSSKIPKIHEQLEEAGRQGMPLIGYHAGDPGDAKGNSAAFPKFEDDAIEIAKAHPKTTFIFAHGLFMLENDEGLDKLAKIFDKHPNVFVDLAFTHNTRQVAKYTVSKARDFYIKYCDRILFGSDVFAAGAGATAFLNERKVLETNLVTNGLHGGPKLEGLNLPDRVLNHIYYWNAARLIPKVRAVLEAQKFKIGYELGSVKFDRLPPDVTVNRLTLHGKAADLTGTLGSITRGLTIEIAGKVYQGIDNQNGTWKLPAEKLVGLRAGTYDVKVSAKNSIGLIRTDSTTGELTVSATVVPKPANFVLKAESFRKYVDEFNKDDQELYQGYYPNAAAWDYLKDNIPLLDCPDKEIQRTYYFRWWTYRKHIKQTPTGFIVDEFLPPVDWAGKYNSINCAAGHHLYEGRWLSDPKVMDDYSLFWFRGGGEPRRYSFWAANSIWARYCVTGNRALTTGLLPDLIANFEGWEKSRQDANGLYWQVNGQDGMEVSIGGNGYRATINSYQYGDAIAIAQIADLAGKADIARQFRQKAAKIKDLVQTRLWDENAKFFKVLPRGENSALAAVREQHGLTPWYFNLPDAQFSIAWRQVMDPKGFYAPYGLTTAEQRHPQFALQYAGHECQWNGPSWPYSTSVTLTGLANLLNGPPQEVIGKPDYFKLLKNYTSAHQLKLDDGRVVPWIDENLNPATGDWISRTRLKSWKNGTWDAGKGGEERGKDYNHSTYCDLVISGLIGLRPRPDETVGVNPLVPLDWEAFCIDRIPYHGHLLTVLWDKSGKKYGKGKGLRVFSDGKQIASLPKIGRLTGQLPGNPGQVGLEPVDPDKHDLSVWGRVKPGVQSGFGSLDVADSRSLPPAGLPTNSINLQGWRGEKVNCKLLTWASGDEGEVSVKASHLSSDSHKIDSNHVSISVVKFVLTDEFPGGNDRRVKDRIPAHLKPDLLSRASQFHLRGPETRPVWISVDIPSSTPPGIYSGTISRQSSTGVVAHPVVLEVQNRLLPPPSEWRFHLDLWQNPYAVARYHRVKLWSPQHLNLLRPLLKKLAEAGQKCITTTLIDRPWGDDQVFDSHGSMIRWTKRSNGTWSFDYTDFDRYVELAMQSGITEQISCYSMVPVGNRFSWFDERTGKTLSAEMLPGSPEYETHWRSFLPNFRAHLRAKGWLNKTTIALDEREEDEMRKLFAFLKDAAPDLKVTMAGFYYKDLNPSIYDFSSNWRAVDQIAGGVMDSRRKAGLKTTYYVACMIPKPNNFTFSSPAESCYEGWFASAMGFDGFLRWAYNSWVEDPEFDSRFVRWPSGDAFLVYPNAQSSIRFERIREGIQDFEKIRILRAELLRNPSTKATAAKAMLEKFMNSINSKTLNGRTAADVINEGKRLLNEIVKSVNSGTAINASN